MKKILLFTFSILYSSIVFGQFPDSLNIKLPWETIYINSCDEAIGAGPTTTSSEVIISEPNISFIQNDNDNCVKRITVWNIFLWTDNSSHEITQLAIVDESIATKSKEQYYIKSNELPKTVSVQDLVINYDPTHTYSFNYDNAFSESYLVTPGTNNFKLYVYDHTAKSVASTDIFITDCEESLTIDIPETFEVKFNKEGYKIITPDFLGVNINYPCGSYEVSTATNAGQNIVYQNLIGETLDIITTVKLDIGTEYKKTTTLIISGLPTDPIKMYIEHKSFTAGEEVKIDVWSTAHERIAAWQFQLEFQNAEINHIQSGNSFSNIANNTYDNNQKLKTIWYSETGLSLDINEDETWFTITITPSIDGTTSDIFNNVPNNWGSISVEDDVDFVEFNVEFDFDVAFRNILSETEEPTVNTHFFSHTLAADFIQLKNLPIDPTPINIYSINGEKVLTLPSNGQSTQQIDIHTLSTGMYIGSMTIDHQIYSFKFFKK